MPAPTPVRTFVLWLDERCAFLRHLEKEAETVLRQQGDEARYRQLMQQKALFLSALAEEAASLIAALPADKARRATERLAAFQRAANTALDLGSVFYMSALLYPDEHKAGEPNNLERFTEEVKSWG